MSYDDHDNPQAWVIGVDKSNHYIPETPSTPDINKELRELRRKHKLAVALIDAMIKNFDRANMFKNKEGRKILQYIEDDIR